MSLGCINARRNIYHGKSKKKCHQRYIHLQIKVSQYYSFLKKSLVIAKRRTISTLLRIFSGLVQCFVNEPLYVFNYER